MNNVMACMQARQSVFLAANGWLKTLILVCMSTSSLAQDSPQALQEQLQKIAQNIHQLEFHLSEDSSNYSLLEAESQQIDKDMGVLHAALRGSLRRIENSQHDLQLLHEQRYVLQAQLEVQTERFKQQLISAYQFNAHSRWQFILNQQSLQNVGRNSVIYNYLHQAQIEQITRIQALNAQLQQNQQAVLANQQNQQQLHLQQQEQYQLLALAREQKQKAKNTLAQLIQENTTAIQDQQNQQRQLANLLEQLKRQQVAANKQAFSQLKGRLKWPVRGSLKNKFGELKISASGVDWTGVSLAAEAGTEIHAIFSGEVVFADWFDHYGWLTIVDHGDNYMSLYAHAEGLYKKTGENVTRGEVIAIVGDSGDTASPNLYFEIRHQGTPVDPSVWCG